MLGVNLLISYEPLSLTLKTQLQYFLFQTVTKLVSESNGRCIFFFFFLQLEHDSIKVIYICIGRDEKQAQNLLPQHQIPFRPLFLHAGKRRKIYAVYEGKPRWLYMVIRWRIAHSWRMWLAGGFITLCKAFQTLMCNRAPLSLCCCSEPPFSSHYKHAAPAVEHLSSLLFTRPHLLLEFKHFHMSLWHMRGLEGKHFGRPLLPRLDISTDAVWCRD